MKRIELFIDRIEDVIINPLIALLFGIALIVFMWGVFEFVRDAASDEGRLTGRRHMIWGIIGMAIMVSVYGIVTLISNTVNF